jgi:hypothetical protein
MPDEGERDSSRRTSKADASSGAGTRSSGGTSAAGSDAAASGSSAPASVPSAGWPGAGSAAAPPIAGTGGTAAADAGPADEPLPVDPATPGSGGQGRAASGEACTTEGAMRCAADGVARREVCDSAIWAPGEPCATGETCTTTSGAADCQPLAALCSGGQSKAVCDPQGMMLMCNADGTAKPLDACPNAMLCMVGLAAGSCASCVPGQHKCAGKDLQVCGSDGRAFTTAIDCKSAALCDADRGACKAAACEAGQYVCQRDTLLQCNAALSAFESPRACGPGLCDEPNKTCRKCLAGAKMCSNDRLLVCDAAGQNFAASPCASATPHCTSAGQCVACRTAADCTPGACQVASCSSAGTCSNQPAPTERNTSGFADKSTVRATGQDAVYVVFGGAKFHVTTPELLDRLYGGFALVQEVSVSAVNGLRSVPVTGTLLKEENMDAVYRAEDNRLRHILREDAVTNNCGGWGALRIVPDGSLVSLPRGPAIE